MRPDHNCEPIYCHICESMPLPGERLNRQPTPEDVTRWQPFADKMVEVRKVLDEADTLIGKLICTLDGNDHTSLALAQTLSRKMEVARMAADIRHPVEQHWSGGPIQNSGPNTLRWRYL